jgi:hypothetical protein
MLKFFTGYLTEPQSASAYAVDALLAEIAAGSSFFSCPSETSIIRSKNADFDETNRVR